MSDVNDKKIEVRLAGLSDLGELVKLFMGYLDFYKAPADGGICEKFLSERLEKKDSTIFIAVNSETSVLGFTQLYPSFSSLSQRSTWILNDLFVDQRFRGQKVGEALLYKAQEFSYKSGAKGLSLQTSLTNKPAQMLYEKNGWIKESDYFTYYLNH